MRADDLTLDEFLRLRVRQVIQEELERSREDVSVDGSRVASMGTVYARRRS